MGEFHADDVFTLYVFIHVVDTVLVTGHVKGADFKYNMFNISEMYRKMNS
jgi:hypothetical protein